jgi:mxaA protein
MRLWLPLVAGLCAMTAAQAAEVNVTLRPERTFGFFVGDVIHAEVEIVAPNSMTLSPASLPYPGPLGVSLILRDVAVREVAKGDRRIWTIGLTYQNFYVALDVRDLQIPGFELRLDGAAVPVPAWTVSVSPLREVAPGPVENARDYMRPDGAPILADEAAAKRFALGSALLATVVALFMARDRAWPPFHRRRARVFSALSISLGKRAQAAADPEAFREALKRTHRAIDAVYGESLLGENLAAFLARYPEFAPLRASFEQFFETSRQTFFGGRAILATADDFSRLRQFVAALARLERAG